jgi:ribonuclease HI
VTAGSGIWYGDNNPRNKSARVPHKSQSNQTGELYAVLLAIKDERPTTNLKIITDSMYVINGLTKHSKKWEEKDWMGVRNSDLFRCITEWMRWRKRKTLLKWTKGHNGNKGNEEADKLAKEGATRKLQMTTWTYDHHRTQRQTARTYPN